MDKIEKIETLNCKWHDEKSMRSGKEAYASKGERRALHNANEGTFYVRAISEASRVSHAGL